MGHPVTYNRTPFLFEGLFMNDEESQPILVGLLKASFRIQDQSEGPLIPLAEQIELNVAGEFNGAPEASSYRYEPEAVLPKPQTDVILIATARPPEAGLSQFEVGLRIGNTVQRAMVFGDRVWLDGAGGPAISRPKPVESVPLIYENAFGGLDKTTLVDGVPALENRNPVGKGYHHASGEFVVGDALPNIENVSQLITSYHDTPAPMGFGFVSPNWYPRAGYAGTYDEKWEASRKPWLPSDFDSRFYNAAHTGLILDTRLNGEERVRVVNASPLATLEFKLPGLPNPYLHMQTNAGSKSRKMCELDTVIIDTDDMLLILTYRASLSIPISGHNVAKIGVTMDGYDGGEHLKSL